MTSEVVIFIVFIITTQNKQQLIDQFTRRETHVNDVMLLV